MEDPNNEGYCTCGDALDRNLVCRKCRSEQLAEQADMYRKERMEQDDADLRRSHD